MGGWECSDCKGSCEQERIDARLKQQARSSRAAQAEVVDVEEELGYQTASSTTMTVTVASTTEQQGYYVCGTCREYPTWVCNGVGQWVECPDCTMKAAEAEYPVQQYPYQ